MSETISFYDNHAEEYAAGTLHSDMSPLCNEFLSLLPDQGIILDLGCGSGRDSRFFIDRGYRVIAVDGSAELCRLAAETIGQPVVCCDFREYEPEGLLIGIWASASLLHLTPEEISGVVSRLAGHLNPGGCFYMSFKYGTFSGERDERFYTDLDETSLKGLLDDIPSLSLIRQKITDDVRPDHSGEKWLNVFCRREQTDVFTVPRQ
ncbi:MAG: class I SAM-dependent methyltransferase [Fretibacterium sp.]|nr:class I SAM-dependent methyltransferase [Fretibacterium sp.]